MAARARSRAACGGERACRSESTYAQKAISCQGSSRTIGCVMAHSKTRNARREPTQQNQCMEGEISIVQSIQLGFSRSLGSATLNDANKSAMLRAEYTITAQRAVLSLAQMKYRYFVSECCSQDAIFSDTGHQNRSYLENVSTNRRYIVGFQQRHCSR